MFRPLAVAVILSAGLLPLRAAEPTAADAFADLQKEWEGKREEYGAALDAAKTTEDRAAVKRPDAAEFAARFVKLADAHPNTDEELAALAWAALCAPKSEAGKAAAERLPKRIEAVKTLAPLRRAVQVGGESDWTAKRALAPAVLAKAKKFPDDPKAASLLTWVCAAHKYDPADKPPPAFTTAADLIADVYADCKDIGNFGWVLSENAAPAYAGEFEGHLKKVLKKNEVSSVVEQCRFALASIALAGGEKRQDEAEKLFREFVTEFETKKDRSGLCETLCYNAKLTADRIKRCGLGKPAQKMEGDDLDGKPVALADYKGKVVVLVFWASWCGPCMADVPHEKELVEKFAGRPFVILGVNGDGDKEQALKAVKKAGIPWRSIWGGEKGAGGWHSEAWCVGGWPTVFVIDHTGVIRHNTLRGAKLDAPLEELVTAAEKAAKK